MTAELETRAAEMGWVPLDKFRGDPERWVDAETFVKRGEDFLPILRSNNKRLETQLEETRRQLAETKGQLDSINSNMGEFLESQKEILKDKLNRQRNELLAQIKVARDDGDVAAEADLQEQLDEVRDQRKTLDAKPEPKKASSAEPPIPPELVAWRGANPWFGGTSREDARLTAMAMQFGREATESGMIGKAMLDYIDREMANLRRTEPPPDKTEEGRPSGQSHSTPGNGKSYKDLPADAKAQCDADAKRFVGQGKMFKDASAWQKHFASIYFEE